MDHLDAVCVDVLDAPGHGRVAQAVRRDRACALDFERAAALRDQLRELKELPELIVSSRTKKDVARKTRGRRKAQP